MADTDLYAGAADVNGRSYRTNALVSTDIGGTEYQVHCFYNVNSVAVIQVRSKSSTAWGDWTTYVYDGTGGLPSIGLAAVDDHRGIQAGIDKDGYLHINYNNHNDNFRYRKSVNPLNTFDGTFGAATSMLGTNENQNSYLRFWNDRAGKLYVTRRQGISTLGDIYFYQYDETTGWAAATGTGTGGILLDGDGVADDTAYFAGIAFDSDFGGGGSGYAHLTWVWRNDGNDGNSNHDIGYVRWDGTTFTQSDGVAQTIPITAANQETATVIAEGSGLAQGGNIAADTDGYPHIVYLRNDDSGYAQIYHLWHNGTAWQTPTALTSQATIQSTGDPENDEWRNPNIVINQANNLTYVLYTLLTKTGIYFLRTTDFATWTETEVTSTATGEWTVVYDPWQWRTNEALYMPLQQFLGSGTNAYYIVQYIIAPNQAIFAVPSEDRAFAIRNDL